MSPSEALEAAWSDVLDNIRGPDTVAALVNVLDKYQQLDRIKERVLAEAAAELHADHVHERQPDTHTAACWLRDQLADGERRARQLKESAVHDGIGWRTIERHKRGAGVVAHRHDGRSLWSIPNSATPPTTTARDGNLTTDA